MNGAMTQPGQAIRRRLKTWTAAGQRSITSATVISFSCADDMAPSSVERPMIGPCAENDIALAQIAAASLTPVPRSPRAGRSEEHTSELQSLMRNSYAVFCLQK